MSTAPKPRRSSVDDLARLRDEGQVVELIDGQIVHKALPTPAHGAAQRKVGAVLDGFDGQTGGPGRPGGWWLMTEVEIQYAKTNEVFRHDLVGFRRDLHPTRPDDMPVKVRPDWVCEVLSPSTARIDVVEKPRTLHAHGVPHVWLVDPTNSLLTVLRWEDDQYRRVLDAGIGDIVRAEPFEALDLDVGSIFGV